jgi:kynureninase
VQAGIEEIREKSIAQTQLLIDLVDGWPAELGFGIGSPRDGALRGSHVAVRHPQAWQVTRALLEVADVVPDFRGPDVVRLGIAPLYTRYVDIWDAMDRLRRLVEAGEHERFDATPGRVT